MSMNQNKEKIMNAVDLASDDLLQMSHQIHANPELGFQEFKAVGFITEVLEKYGFDVIKNYGGIETSFRATKKGKMEGPRIAFLAEYDALPEIGHGCGHNVIATCGIGAFLGLSKVVEEYAGEVSIIGTPAEEGGGGKVVLLANGAFDDIDYALIMHPTSGKALINRGGRACVSVNVKFKGVSTHSSSPESGVNALNAVISLFNHIDMQRPTFSMSANINGIIVKGGTASNIIPDDTEADFSVRAATMHELEYLVETIKCSAKAAELLTKATAVVEVGEMYAERYPSLPICEAFKSNMESLGEEMFYPDPNMKYGSSDIGNVSIKIPAIHDYLPIAPAGVNSHAIEFTEASISPRADEVCIKGAKGLAMTGLDILENEVLRKEIATYHEKQIPDCYK